MYISPIEVQLENMHDLVMETTQDGIVRAVWNMGFKVNAEQLTKALTQDRKRYEYAYDQGWNDCKKEYEEKLKKIYEIADEKLKKIYELAKDGENEDEQ